MQSSREAISGFSSFARLRVIFLTGLSALAFLIGSNASLAQSATGDVSGRVQNATNGRFMNNARITVDGTGRETFTNEFGEFRLTNLAEGPATIRAFFTGMESQTLSVTVTAGQIAEVNFRLARPGFDIPEEGDVIRLDEFVIAEERETNAAAIAANEQRFSSSLKNVVSSDAFGDVTEGNIGEFMKFIPGVSVDYVAADVRTMSVRGFADNFTSVSVDGARMASSASGASSRSFEFEQVSINNVARIEVTKAPTPSMPADSLGGAVNMVSKNAFERSKAQFKYRAYVSFNSEDLDFFKKTPGPMGRPTNKVKPGVDFDYTLPVNKDFGIVITALSSNQFNEQHRSQKLWNFAQAGATATNPYLQSYLFQDGPKNTFRDSVSLKADWRIAPGKVLSATVQSNYYLSTFGNRNFTYNAGTTATATSPSSGAPLTYSPTMTSGAQGRGSVQGQTSFRDKAGKTDAANVSYRQFGEKWDIEAGVNYSKSKTWYRDTGRGHFSEVRTTMNSVSRVLFDNIDDIRPQTITVLNSTGGVLDPTKLSSYNMSFGRGNPIDAQDEFQGFDVSAKRTFSNLGFPASIKAGISVREQTRDIQRFDESWNFVGPGSTNAAIILDTSYINQDPHYGLPPQEWPNPYLAYSLFQSNPAYFSQTTAQALAALRFRLQNSQYLEETITAYYLQAEAKFLDQRLNVVTGVRFEKTEDSGRGLLTKGLGDTIARVQSNWVERGYSTNRGYDDYYPSIHLTYNVTNDLLLRLSYAKTMGRPDFSQILPLTRVNDTLTDFNDGIGTIQAQTVIVNNTGLQPWSSDGYDLSLEYYFPKGGVASIGTFRKELTDFWGTDVRTVTQADIVTYDLDASTLGFQFRTANNVGDARISGWEFNFQQPLGILGSWGKDLNAFVNATKLDLVGPNEADFNKFIEESASWGVTYSSKPVVFSLKWNYRGRQRLGFQTGAAYGAAGGFQEYYEPRTFMDVNAEYQFSKRFTLFANARNILNVPQVLQRYNETSPAYSHNYRTEEFGVQIAVGVKGSF